MKLDNLDKIIREIRNNFNSFRLVLKTNGKNNSSKSFLALHLVEYRMNRSEDRNLLNKIFKDQFLA